MGKESGKEGEDYDWYKSWTGIGGDGVCKITPPPEVKIDEGCDSIYPYRTKIPEEQGLYCYNLFNCAKDIESNKKEGDKCKKIEPQYKLLQENMECQTTKGEEKVDAKVLRDVQLNVFYQMIVIFRLWS